MAEKALHHSTEPGTDYISRLPQELRFRVFDFMDGTKPRSSTEVMRKLQLSDIAAANRSWNDSVTQYKDTEPFRQRHTVIVYDLTSLLLGRAASEVEVYDGDTVGTILDRSGARLRLERSPLRGAATWVLQKPVISGDSVPCTYESWAYQSRFMKQTLESWDWLEQRMAERSCKPPSVISIPATTPIWLEAKNLLNCPIDRQLLSSTPGAEEIVTAITAYSCRCENGEQPLVNISRILSSRLEVLPRRAVFHEERGPSAYVYVRQRQPTAEYAFDHECEVNVTNRGEDWPDWESRMKSLCQMHSALMEMSSSTDGSVTKLNFVVDEEDQWTANLLAERHDSTKAFFAEWNSRITGPNRIEVSFGGTPSELDQDCSPLRCRRYKKE